MQTRLSQTNNKQIHMSQTNNHALQLKILLAIKNTKGSSHSSTSFWNQQIALHGQMFWDNSSGSEMKESWKRLKEKMTGKKRMNLPELIREEECGISEERINEIYEKLGRSKGGHVRSTRSGGSYSYTYPPAGEVTEPPEHLEHPEPPKAGHPTMSIKQPKVSGGHGIKGNAGGNMLPRKRRTEEEGIAGRSGIVGIEGVEVIGISSIVGNIGNTGNTGNVPTSTGRPGPGPIEDPERTRTPTIMDERTGISSGKKGSYIDLNRLMGNTGGGLSREPQDEFNRGDYELPFLHRESGEESGIGEWRGRDCSPLSLLATHMDNSHIDHLIFQKHIKELEIMATDWMYRCDNSLAGGTRQGVKSLYEYGNQEDLNMYDRFNKQIFILMQKYDVDFEHIMKLYDKCNSLFKVDRMLKGEDVVIWSPLEDMALTKGELDPMYQYILHAKGDNALLQRKKFLQH